MKPFTTLTIIFLSLLSVLQLVRFLQGWDVIINGVAIPTWVSGLACLIAGGLALMLWRESRR
ncbi:hypothetical protein [Lysobacter sp. CFH 32150]|uniref:hypothetical protein n=1 Tax=Lysobacter sp. CFH 32150 TaxID=2927128 RepID=UPI001FA70255|nr:hypothetical protein [Lysobacter sp. CFH 32150]MCI4568992.1 hypothetical protein [Lysobacter sp. CFH 32150]